MRIGGSKSVIFGAWSSAEEGSLQLLGGGEKACTLLCIFGRKLASKCVGLSLILIYWIEIWKLVEPGRSYHVRTKTKGLGGWSVLD